MPDWVTLLWDFPFLLLGLPNGLVIIIDQRVSTPMLVPG